jgi:hypothetical protein
VGEIGRRLRQGVNIGAAGQQPGVVRST